MISSSIVMMLGMIMIVMIRSRVILVVVRSVVVIPRSVRSGYDDGDSSSLPDDTVL